MRNLQIGLFCTGPGTGHLHRTVTVIEDIGGEAKHLLAAVITDVDRLQRQHYQVGE
ncbi:hypothetical protein [Arthrobacter sp.]|uniref:hypothetical protein n=1 Tax=Arthrobacter sp. TaxID=1667 RepID=UPI0028120C72|nr:hypothetical protein [Arthrobacter sp.]